MKRARRAKPPPFATTKAKLRHMPVDERAGLLAEIFRFVAAEFALLIRDGVEVLKTSRELRELAKPAKAKPKPKRRVMRRR